jgi:hypothetical protein
MRRLTTKKWKPEDLENKAAANNSNGTYAVVQSHSKKSSGEQAAMTFNGTKILLT